MTDILIRTATEADLPDLPMIERDATQRYREVGYDYCADGPIRDMAEHVATLRNGTVLVAEASDGSLLGFAMVRPADNAAHLVELDVRRAAQGRGLGRRLIAGAEAWAIGRGLEEITLTTYRDVAWNAPAYARLGFEIFEVGPERAELLAIQEAEAAEGFARWPRVAMRKRLGEARDDGPP